MNVKYLLLCQERKTLFASLVILHAFFVICCFFQNQLFLKNYFRNTIRVSNSLDPDRHYIGPDLDPNCLQRISADDTSRWS